MKLIRLIAIAFALLPFAVSAQAPLPTGWDFTSNTPPQGWSQSGTTTYSSAPLVVVAPSCKLSGTGQYVQSFLSDAPGRVKYYIGGATANGNAWAGTFTIQESVNGTTWTALKTYTTLPVSGGLVADSVTPNQASRYIRWYFTNKVSGSNVAIDNLNIAVAPPGAVQEINVKYNGVNQPSGSTIYINGPVGTATSFTLNVENQGITDPLLVNTPTFSGANSSDFSLTTYLPTVVANSTGSVVFGFNPPIAGTRLAQISIPSNDANENPYIINIYAVGGNYATEPSAQATNLTFPTTKSFRVKGQFSSTNPPVDGGYIVLRKIGSAITETPADGSVYTRGDYIGQAQVVSTGQVTSFIPSYTIANTTYYFAVFAYNGTGVYTNYAQNAPLIGQVTTPDNTIGNYYAGIDKTSPNFVTSLTALTNPHNQVFYGDYDETMVRLFQARDTTGGQKVITCAYTGNEYVYTEPFVWDVYSREHTFCHIWMATHPADNPEKPEYDDQHNLYPVIFAQSNLPRSDNPLGEVDSTLQSFEDGKLGYDTTLTLVYEPRDAHKGRAARAIMYMPTCYDGINGVNNWQIPGQQSQSLLKKWHFQFPPDNFDKARNDFLDSLQNNRNPFVDSVDFVCYIDFLNMAHIANPANPCYANTVGVKENKSQMDVSVFPVPSFGHFNVRIAADKQQVADLYVTDMTGRIIYERKVTIAKGPNLYDIDLDNFESGMYNITIRTNTSLTSRHMVVIH